MRAVIRRPACDRGWWRITLAQPISGLPEIGHFNAQVGQARLAAGAC